MNTWFARLRRILGHSDQRSPAIAPVDVREAGIPVEHQSTEERAIPKAPKTGRSVGYLAVVGLDFGTAYTKCVIRDANVRDPGRAYTVPFQLADGWSYLVPSVIFSREDRLLSTFDVPAASDLKRFDYLKMRLVADCDKRRGGAWRGDGSGNEAQFRVAWFLAQVLSHAGQEIRRRWGDFGARPDDFCFINLGVPIAYADDALVEPEMLNALCAAANAVGKAGTVAPTAERIREELGNRAGLSAARDFCYTYPETSANLQSYIKSRARRPGLYLFSDVGAGTVDLSFFILHSDSGLEKPLIYLHGSVLDAGSSRLELKAMEIDPNLDRNEVIAYKEGRCHRVGPAVARALRQARDIIWKEVARGVGRGVKETQVRLHIDPRAARNQMKKVTLLFAGGGFVPDPYEKGVRYFHRAMKWDREPPSQSVPTPEDLHWPTIREAEHPPFSRLSVAYGLSFPRIDLEGHKFPSEVHPHPDAPRMSGCELPSAPTMDEV